MKHALNAVARAALVSALAGSFSLAHAADPIKIGVAGPFTVESLSPHRIAPADEIVDETLGAEGRRKRDKATAPTQDSPSWCWRT